MSRGGAGVCRDWGSLEARLDLDKLIGTKSYVNEEPQVPLTREEENDFFFSKQEISLSPWGNGSFWQNA